MIDTIEQAACKNCGRTIAQKAGKGHRKREFCSPRCKQADYRARHGVTIGVTLEEQNIRHIEQYAIDCSIAEGKAKERIAQLEQELSRYRKIVDLSDRQKMIAQFMLIGEEIGYKPLLSVDVRPGLHAWYAFSQTADNEHLAAAIVAAKNLYKILADLQTTKEVEQLNKIIADLRLERNALRQELDECNRDNPDSR